MYLSDKTPTNMTPYVPMKKRLENKLFFADEAGSHTSFHFY
jgi:hypothetical protein